MSAGPMCVILFIGALLTAAATLSHVIPSRRGGGVAAVTSLANDVFLVRDPSLQRVEVYDAVSCALSRLITVHGLGGTAWGLASCAHFKCLYVSDRSHHSIYRAELTGTNAVI